MKLSAALELVQNDLPIVVRDKTFSPRGVDEATLETGEHVYWVYTKDGMWLSFDPDGEEILLFEDINEELEPEDDTVVYGGEDYEFSYEGVAKVDDADGGTTTNFKEYQNADGDVIRIMEDESTGDLSYAFGVKITEEDLQEA
ncbi:MAG: hypothetical protein WAZ14_04015 [Patescibacteria group bacterium]